MLKSSPRAEFRRERRENIMQMLGPLLASAPYTAIAMIVGLNAFGIARAIRTKSDGLLGGHVGALFFCIAMVAKMIAAGV